MGASILRRKKTPYGVTPHASEGLSQACGGVKELVLPTKEQFRQLVLTIESSGAGKAKPCADLVRFLAYTGARLDEAQHVTWHDVDLDRKSIVLRVTKNGEPRRVPLSAECLTLLTRLRSKLPSLNGNQTTPNPVLSVKECQKSLDSACMKVGMQRITHHDLRHLFATICIESGMDIPTLARLLGHKDGGVLAMRVYGHLRDEHAQAMMARVSYS